MDEFAQTRPPDDLFADDFTPIDEPVVEEAIAAPVEKIPSSQRAPRVRGSQRARGAATFPRPQTKPQALSESPTNPDASAQSPDAPRQEAVRGDRSGTGGVKKARLTEEELSARMEAIKLKNASLEAAHARAEADEASFHAREAEAHARRRVERQNRQQMMGERERNRLRKLNAVQGREWDAEKGDYDGEERGGRSQFRRGAYGGVAGGVPPPAADTADEPASSEADGFSIRGGARGRGRGRGSGRSARPSERPAANQAAKEQAVPTTDDFPALSRPAGTPPALQSPEPPTPQHIAIPNAGQISTGGGQVRATDAKGASWAEEMETPTTA